MKLTTLIIILFALSFSVNAQDVKKEWTLKECIDYALDNNLDVQRSLLNLQGNDIDLEQAKWSRLPNLNASGSFGPNWGRSIDPTTNLFVNQRINSAGLNASSSVTLFNAFRIQNNIKQAEFALQAGEKDLEVSKNNVILNVISFYTNVLFTRELHQNALSQLKSTKEQVDLTQKQVDAGALPKANLLDLQAQAATNELNVVTAENNWILAKIQLKQILQLPPQNEVDIVVPEIDVDNADLSISAYEVYQNALASRPEIQSAELNIKSSEHGINAAKANLYPTISLNAGARTNYSDIIDERFIPDPNSPTVVVTDASGQPVFAPVNGLRTVGTQQAIEQLQVRPNGEIVDFGFTDQFDENLSYFLSLGINIPIFNGFSARSNIQRSIITKDRAAINDKDVRYQLWRTIEQAYTDVKAASKSYESSLKAVEARTEAFRVIQQRKLAGAVNATDYEIAQNNLAQAENDLTRAKYDYIFKIKLLDFYQGKELKF